MSRIFSLFILFALFVGLAANAKDSGAGNKKQPNVLFIVVDDLNDWVSHLDGHPQSKTPNIDDLVARGVSFSNAHTAAPACNPSRAAVMSGLRPHTSGVYYNGSDSQVALKNIPTLNEHFMANGYEAAAGGKIYHALDGNWDRYWQRKGGVRTSHNKNGLGMGHFDWGPIDTDDKGMAEHHLVNWAIEEMNTPREKPLFLAVGFVKPHLPFFAPKKYFEQYPLDEVQLPAYIDNDLDDLSEKGVQVAIRIGEHARVVETKQWEKAVQGYLATIAYVDYEIGRLMKAFDASPIAEDTIIVFWSDHGWNLGEKQHWRKFALWNDTTRVPFSITAPGITKAKTSTHSSVDLQSIYPTLCDLADIPIPEHVEGENIRPLLENPNIEWDKPALSNNGIGNYMLQTEHYRLIRYSTQDKELYDHRTDPHEWYNLANKPEYQGLIAQMEKMLPSKNAPAVPKATKRLKEREERQKKIYSKDE